MRILITGVTGYVGGALVPRLQADGHELRGFARNPDRANIKGTVPFMSVRGDVTTGAVTRDALRANPRTSCPAATRRGASAAPT